MLETLLIVLLALAAVAAGVAAWRWTSWWRRLHRTRVLVHTRSGNTFDGFLVTVARDGVILDGAKLGPSRPLDGHVFVPRAQIAWFQKPPADVAAEDV